MSAGEKTDGVAEAQKRALEIAAKLTSGGYNNGSEDGSRKRPLDDGEGPDTKKPPTDFNDDSLPTPKLIAQQAISKIAGQLGFAQTMTIEIKVPNRMVGLVIGRQGEMINKLQAESGAKIQVAPDGSEVSGERSVSISGTPDTVEKAKLLVNGVIENAGGVTSVVTNLEAGQEVVELMIPAGKVGLIIGKGGEMIKMLQERAGCKMQMIQDGPYASTPEKPLRMTGFSENCKKARQLVLDLMEQKELEARGLTGDLSTGLPEMIEMRVPSELVGFIIGRNGENINNIQSLCNVRLQFHHDIPHTPYRLTTIAGKPLEVQKAKRMVEEMVGERQQTGIKPRIDLPDPQGPQVQTVSFPIPANKCGLIIGKGGDTVRQLMVQSNCHIELDRGPNTNPQEKLFNLRGLPQNIQAAQNLIRQKLEGGGIPGDPYAGMAAYGGIHGMGGAQGWGQYGSYGGGYPTAGGYGGGAPHQQQPPQGGAPGGQQSSEAAWAAYYQQLQAYTQQQQQQQGGGGGPGGAPQGGSQQVIHKAGGPPSSGAAGSNDLQAQWAEYYRQMYYYQQQQQGAGGGPPPGQGGPPQTGGMPPRN
ncbi:PREDICTED: far upstream element-binding protein 1-like isoform X2 [Amphimedon queenslandica]|uniref:K Homology domain-containing protein n=1 Tax=Amphimedon queenslandica TaxID=400682 RepID=A0AAN0J890_AMPQE|nr:PREDICTED: far upstream element-binding protein 1-like isoform X2 [Amphimedon queenslandica]|eukprot:XP_019852923.1 PREDICTED: far upstream element-binding protein 1-like isoform X2 [Amphimedon queenslandica]